MRTHPFTVWLCLMLTWLGAASGLVHAQEKPRDFVVVPAGEKVKLSDVYGVSHALLIGINKYSHASDHNLRYAVNDVNAMAAVLRDSYGFTDVTVLTDEKASFEGIRRALASLTDKNKIKPDDRVLIYFSGHGQTVSLDGSGEMGFLIPSDAEIDLNDASNPAPYNASCLPMSMVQNYLLSSPAKHVLMIADACYSGLLAQPRGGGGISPEALSVWAHKKARQVMTAGSGKQQAKESAELGHGVFTYKLLEELKERAADPNAIFTTMGLCGSLRERVMTFTKGQQTPQLFNYNEDGEFLFLPTAPVKTVINPEPKPHTKVKKNAKDNAEMIFIPAGEFIMGITQAEINVLDKQYPNPNPDQNNYFRGAGPRHQVRLDSYYIYKNLVTVGQYKKFCEATSHAMPFAPSFNPNWSQEDHPIVNVSWNDAKACCDWAGVRLPTEAEWEKAAAWDKVNRKQRKFPWGDNWDESRCASHLSGTKPVGSYPLGASYYGVLDMAGNAWQWCSDWYDRNFYSNAKATERNPKGPVTGDFHVRRGGSWTDVSPVSFYSAYRIACGPGYRYGNDGFRCVVSGP